MFELDKVFNVVASRLEVQGRVSGTVYNLKPGDTFRIKRISKNSILVDQMAFIYEDCSIKNLDLIKICVQKFN